MATTNFRDVIAWQKSYDVSLHIYNLTKSFPKDEIFNLVSQMRRASVSVCSNIAEGLGRTGIKEKDQFYAIAKGSLTEVECQTEIARGVGIINDAQLAEALHIIKEAQRVLAGLQKANKERNIEAKIL